MIKPFRNVLSARRGAALVCVLAVFVHTSTPCVDLVELMEGNQPLSHFDDAQWPGLRAVVNDASRVLFTEGPVTQQSAFYQGDTTALERILRAFAAAEIEERVVVLLPGRGGGFPLMDKSSFYDWRLDMDRGEWRVPTSDEILKLIRHPHPILTVYVGGAVDLKRLRIPDGVVLRAVDTLLERYRQGLLSRDSYARRVSAHGLSELDPYGEESANAVKRLLQESGRNSVEKVFATFEDRAADPPDVRAKYENDELRIRVELKMPLG